MATKKQAAKAAKKEPQSPDNPSGGPKGKTTKVVKDGVHGGALRRALKQPPVRYDPSKFALDHIQILKAGVKDGVLSVAYDKFYHGLPHPIFAVENSPNRVHVDLEAAFDLLRPHYAVIFDTKESEVNGKPIDPRFPPEDLMRRIKVTAFHVNGEGDEKNIILTGQRRKLNNQVVCGNTPVQKFQDSAFPYPYAEHLRECLDIIEKEIRLCLNGKYAPVLELFDEMKDTAEEEVEFSNLGSGKDHAAFVAVGKKADKE